MMAYRTQEKLRSQFYSNIDNTNPVQDDDIQDIKDTAKKTEDRGLLHSILTKVCIYIYIYCSFISTISHIFMYNLLSPCFAGCDRNFN